MPRPSKGGKNNEEGMKNIYKSNEYWNDWKFQIYLNTLEWVVPIRRNVKKTLIVNFPTSFI